MQSEMKYLIQCVLKLEKFQLVTKREKIAKLYLKNAEMSISMLNSFKGILEDSMASYDISSLMCACLFTVFSSAVAIQNKQNLLQYLTHILSLLEKMGIAFVPRILQMIWQISQYACKVDIPNQQQPIQERKSVFLDIGMMKQKLFLKLQKMGNNQSNKESQAFQQGAPKQPQSTISISKQSETAIVTPITEPFPFCDQHFLIEICSHPLQSFGQFSLLHKDSANTQITSAQSHMKSNPKFSPIANQKDVEYSLNQNDREEQESQEHVFKERTARRSKNLSKYRIEDCEFSETTETYLG